MTMNVEDKVNMRLDMLTRDGSPGHIHMINYFTKYRDEIFQYEIFQSDVKPSSIEELPILHLHSFLGMRWCIKKIGAMPAEARMAASEKGYENGLGAMPAEARMEVSEMGYENGLGAMSTEERIAARRSGMGIKWENKYAEFKRCVVTPEEGTKLYSWQHNQLGTGPAALNTRIRKEIEENEGSTVWSDRTRVRLVNCVSQKKRDALGNKWENKYAEFKRCVVMPVKGTKLYLATGSVEHRSC